MSAISKAKDILPGLILSIVITASALATEKIQRALIGSVLLDGLVVSIILGTLVHTFCGLSNNFLHGVKFASKYLLELAIVLLGASISLSSIASTGAAMFATVAGVVMISLIVSYTIGCAVGLPSRLALLVACGNSICGNSAIVAAAPVIDADSDEVAASIAFTAALGIVVVLLLPVAFALFHLSQWQYGIVAGMTVYAVPQVLAATLPVGAMSAQIGTIVKLMRVLMLGPVVMVLGFTRRKEQRLNKAWKGAAVIPWFIAGFVVLMLVRSAGWIPQGALDPMRSLSTFLTTISMAALGLSVNLRTVLASGGRVLAAGTLSILALSGLAALTLTFLPAL
ncbi:YeiH family protein [Oryzifoliimicrobium ureilyticus]|uniref:YeiH family protein n=1 Tax=Oryzifoliimicrobium ureilyticus TaxID=3113724 RepID=UPI0030764806